MSLGDLPAKLRAFGFDLIELADGNDAAAVVSMARPIVPGKPRCILGRTVRGKGVSLHGKSGGLALKGLQRGSAGTGPCGTGGKVRWQKKSLPALHTARR